MCHNRGFVILENGSNVIWEQFRNQAERYADTVAVTVGGRETTFARLFADAEVMAGQLAALGIGQGAVVGHALKNGLEFVVAYLALCRLSATVALVPEKYQRAELDLIVRHLRPTCFLIAGSQAETFARKLPEGEPKEINLGPDRETTLAVFPAAGETGGGEAASAPDKQAAFDHPVALVKFTSGSTGAPKAVALSAANVLAETENVIATLGLGPDDRILAALPLSHSYGFDLGVLAMLASGARLIIHEGFIPRKVIRELTGGTSVFLGVPSMYKVLLDTHLDRPVDLSAVRYLLSCTAPLGAATIKAFHDRFGAWICQHYGSSETGAAANHEPRKVADHPEAVGRAMRNVAIAVVDGEGRRLAVGEEGEVVISGEAVAMGYLIGRPPGRARLAGGVYHTGDIGRLDGDGFLTIKGRLDGMINVGGNKVSPEEVAAVIESHPSVREAAAVGMKDATGDEFVVVAAAVREPVTEEALIVYCRGLLAAYKMPRRIVFMAELPKGPSGKTRVTAGDIIL